MGSEFYVSTFLLLGPVFRCDCSSDSNRNETHEKIHHPSAALTANDRKAISFKWIGPLEFVGAMAPRGIVNPCDHEQLRRVSNFSRVLSVARSVAFF